VYTRLRSSGDESIERLALGLAQQFGDNAAAETLLATLKDGGSDVAKRREALEGLARQRYPRMRGELLALLDEAPLRRDAIRAMASFDDERLARALLERYGSFGADEKLEAIHTLASRPRSGWRLTQAIQNGDVPRRDVPAYVARQLRRVVGSGFVEIWGPLDALPAETAADLEKYRALLTEEALAGADPRRGRAVFNRTCLTCHRMYGEGGLIGPEITGANRTDLSYVLGNVLTPSDVIQDDYRMVLVLTHEGRLYSGILAGENERQISLRVAGQDEPEIIPKSSIASREIAKVSMMPEGLLRELTDAEVLDLVAYLRTPAQVPLPETTEATGE
jgi:putative heme-binding domain-containing protein